MNTRLASSDDRNELWVCILYIWSVLPMAGFTYFAPINRMQDRNKKNRPPNDSASPRNKEKRRSFFKSYHLSGSIQWTLVHLFSSSEHHLEFRDLNTFNVDYHIVRVFSLREMLNGDDPLILYSSGKHNATVMDPPTKQYSISCNIVSVQRPHWVTRQHFPYARGRSIYAET